MKFCPSCGARYEDAAKFCQNDGTLLRSAGRASDEDPYVGQILLGQFEIKEVIGEGGMGRVYRAHQHGFDRPVAIKILHTDLVANPEMVKRFNREAKIISHLDHPSIIHVYLFGELPDGNLYLAMEYVDGQGLTKLINEGPVPVPQSVHIARQILSALTEAHRKGVVHRDLKPDNIMLVARPDDPQSVKVLDFGIAKFLGSRTMLTQQGLVFGSARYISPEAAAGESVDERADLYAVGVILYQMLSGKPPFDDASAVSLLLRHVNDKPPPLLKQPAARHVPEGIAQVVMQALEKDPARRFSGAAAMRTALTEAALAAGVPLQGDDAVSVSRPPSHGRAQSPAPVTIPGAPQTLVQEPAEGRGELFKTDPMFGGAMTKGGGKTGPDAPRPSGHPPAEAPQEPPAAARHGDDDAEPAAAVAPESDDPEADRTSGARASGAVPDELEELDLPRRRRAWVFLLVLLILVLAGGAMGGLLAIENRDEGGSGEVSEPAKQVPTKTVTPTPPPPEVVPTPPADAGPAAQLPPQPPSPTPPTPVQPPPPTPQIGVGGQDSTGQQTNAGTSTPTKATGVRPHAGTTGAGDMPPSATLAVEPRRPQVGQKVRLTAKVSPATTLSSPRFLITFNKGQPVLETAEAGEGGTYSARHTFNKAGTYSIAFVGTSSAGEVQAFTNAVVAPPPRESETQQGSSTAAGDNKPPDHEDGPPPQLIEPWISPTPW